MNRIKDKVMKVNFTRFFKIFIPLAIVLALLGGVATGIGLHETMSESVGHAWQQDDDGGRMEQGNHDGNYERGDNGNGTALPYHEGRGSSDDDFMEGMVMMEENDDVMAIIGLYGGGCLLLLAIYWLAVAACLYQRATVSKMNGLLWLLLGLCGNVIAALAFVIIRSYIRQKCPECGSWQAAGRWYCTQCGAETGKSCPECGDLCGIDDKFCSRCGKSFAEGKETSQAGDTEPEGADETDREKAGDNSADETDKEKAGDNSADETGKEKKGDKRSG